MRELKKTTIAATVLASTVLLSGCGLFGNGDKGMEEIDPPQNVTIGDKDSVETTSDKEKTTNEDATSATVTRELYLVDKNGLVVPHTVQLPKTESVAKQAIDYLVKGGPVTEMLPNGFSAVLPQDTQVSVNVKGTTAIVNFSKEFNEYEAEDEMKILQSITWTLTQFENIKDVEIQVNGFKLEEMPVNGTPISSKLSRADGINLDTGDVVDITNSRQVTLYFLAQDGDNEYDVPITRRIDKNEKDMVAAVVKSLIEGPGLSSNLLSEFHPDVKLIGHKYEDGKVTLDFSKDIFGSLEEKMISKHVINSLVLSLTEQQGIESVSITVDSDAEIMDADGKVISEPVTRLKNVNTGSF